MSVTEKAYVGTYAFALAYYSFTAVLNIIGVTMAEKYLFSVKNDFITKRMIGMPVIIA